ncbi:MAG: hypothetical protein AB7I33_02145 [Gemmatimonadales bacterium]
MRRLALLLIPFGALVAAACTDPNQLPPASLDNYEDTLTLGALRGTPIQVPSGYSVTEGAVRTDQTSAFDLAYDVDDQGRHVFIPLIVLGVRADSSIKPGLQLSSNTFEGITEAARNGYITDDSVAVDSGQVYLVRSRLVCSFGVPQYAKMQIIMIDDSARTISFRVLANNNCGYISLKPGIPQR